MNLLKYAASFAMRCLRASSGRERSWQPLGRRCHLALLLAAATSARASRPPSLTHQWRVWTFFCGGRLFRLYFAASRV